MIRCSDSMVSSSRGQQTSNGMGVSVGMLAVFVAVGIGVWEAVDVTVAVGGTVWLAEGVTTDGSID